MVAIWLGVSGAAASGMRLNPPRAAALSPIILTIHERDDAPGMTRVSPGLRRAARLTSALSDAPSTSVSPA